MPLSESALSREYPYSSLLNWLNTAMDSTPRRSSNNMFWTSSSFSICHLVVVLYCIPYSMSRVKVSCDKQKGEFSLACSFLLFLLLFVLEKFLHPSHKPI